jgi:CO/xanthine dehydrogenase FAD-binding subunit
MMTIQNYVRPSSLEEAYTLNQNKRNRIVGGMLWLKMMDIMVPTAIDLCDLGLDTIEENDEEFSIGAMVTLRQLELHREFNIYTENAARKSVEDIIGVQFRNMATVGGSIYGRFGFSDVLTMFMSMDSYVELYKGGIIPMEEFAKMPYDRDILVRVIVKKHPGNFTYLSMRNTVTDFPVIACALSYINQEYRAVIGARPNKAMIIRDDKGYLKEGLNHEAIQHFADYVADNTPTGSNMRGSAAYRTHLIRVLTTRAVGELKEAGHGN